VTTSCWLSIAALALGATAAGCGDDSSEDAPKTNTGGGEQPAAQTCSGDASELRSSFRPLPEGLRYRPLPPNVEKQAESKLDDRFAGFDGRQIVKDGAPYAAMTVYVVEQEIEDEEEHLAGFADGFAEGADPEKVDIGGAEATRVDGPEQSVVVRVFDKCRVVGVIAPSGDRAQTLARTVLR
jgi:hypothetical protein